MNTATHGATARPQPLIVVADVEASGRWYRQLLGCASGHGGPHYERLFAGDRLILQLHHREIEDHHGRIGDPALPYGNGLLLWFETDDFDAAIARATAMRAEIVRAPHVNPNPDHRECWLRDPDGYTVVVASPDGEASGTPHPQ